MRFDFLQTLMRVLSSWSGFSNFHPNRLSDDYFWWTKCDIWCGNRFVQNETDKMNLFRYGIMCDLWWSVRSSIRLFCTSCIVASSLQSSPCSSVHPPPRLPIMFAPLRPWLIALIVRVSFVHSSPLPILKFVNSKFTQFSPTHRLLFVIT